MEKLVLVMIALVVVRCSVVVDEVDDVAYDAAADGDGDGDGDGDSDGDVDGVGDTCQTTLLTLFNMEGTCREPQDECPGGSNPNKPAGNCPEGLVCCIGQDQCQRYAPAARCQKAGCMDDGGWTIGCPEGQWCCPVL